MQVLSHLLDCIHLDPGYALLSVQNCISCLEMFRMMDIHNNASINDRQFRQFIHSFTDLSKSQSDTLFELLDVDHSGEMEFGEFYLVFCILIACKDQYEKEFIYRHSRNIFRLIDADQSGLISSPEFQQMGVLFNFDYDSIQSIFEEFDVSGDKNLDFTEFRLFTMACIDQQRCADAKMRVKVLTDYHQRFLRAMEFLIRMYTITERLPIPKELYAELKKVVDPFIPDIRHRFSYFDWPFIRAKFACRGMLVHRVELFQGFIWKVLRVLFCWFCCCTLGKKCKMAVKDSEGWKCGRKARRMRHAKRLMKKRFPENLYREIRYHNRRVRMQKIALARAEAKKGLCCGRKWKFRKTRRIANEPAGNTTTTTTQEEVVANQSQLLQPAAVVLVDSSETKASVSVDKVQE